LNENTLDDEQSSAVSDLHKALADEVQKQLALYDRVLELESKFTIVSSASNSDLSKEKLQEEIGSAEAFPCELLSSVNDNTTSAAKIVEDSLVDQPRQAAKELDALSVEQSEHELTTTDVKVPSESAVEQELAPSCQDIPSRKSSVAAETRELVSSQPVETDFLVDITGNKSLDNQPTAKEIDIKGTCVCH
jgi:hypothetical protein